MLNLGRYAKAITALVTAVLGWFAVVIAASPDHFTVSNSQWLALGVAVATALGVYAVPNAVAVAKAAPVQVTLPDPNLPPPVAPWDPSQMSK